MSRAANGSGSVTQARSGRWTARASIGGKQVSLGTFGTKREAREACATAIANGASSNGATPRRRRKPRGSSSNPTTIAKGIGAYLDELAEGGSSRSVALGGLKGFPNATSDPEVVEQVIAALREREAPAGPIARLKREQRILDLTRAAELLREHGAGSSPEDYFVEHAGAWAEANGISYEAFRVMGVPAGVLRRAGVG